MRKHTRILRAMLRIAFVVFVLLTALPVVVAQTFSGFALVGATASQIDGDDLAGFNKLGALAGGGVFVDLSDRWRTSLALAFVQTGSSATSTQAITSGSVYDRIELDYVALPLRAHYMDWLSDDEFFYRLEFVAGLEYRRMIREQIILASGDEYSGTSQFRNNVLDLTGGVLYAWALNWAAGIHYNRAITGVQLNTEQSQYAKQLSLRLRYIF